MGRASPGDLGAAGRPGRFGSSPRTPVALATLNPAASAGPVGASAAAGLGVPAACVPADTGSASEIMLSDLPLAGDTVSSVGRAVRPPTALACSVPTREPPVERRAPLSRNVARGGGGT